MNETDLLKSLDGLDEKLLKRSERRAVKRRLAVGISSAAAAVLAAVGAFFVVRTLKRSAEQAIDESRDAEAISTPIASQSPEPELRSMKLTAVAAERNSAGRYRAKKLARLGENEELSYDYSLEDCLRDHPAWDVDPSYYECSYEQYVDGEWVEAERNGR